jgi:hypothetical protein
LEALYNDLLLAELYLPSEHKAKLVLSDPGFDLLSYVAV